MKNEIEKNKKNEKWQFKECLIVFFNNKASLFSWLFTLDNVK